VEPAADWSTKGLWLPDDAVPDDAFAAAGHGLFEGPFGWPVMVAKRSAMAANIATMAAYCARHGVEIAPHGKTTMAPTLFAAQLEAGAWGITVATPGQALAARHLGVPRVLLANELLDARALRWAAAEIAAGWDLMFYVDSLDGVAAAAEAAPARGRPMRVFVEMGYAGGRTGCRTVEQASAVARAVAATEGLELAGVAGFEGLLPDSERVVRLLDDIVAVAGTVGDLCPYPMIVSVGGSAFFDTVVERLTGPAGSRGWRVLLRSGCYITHDHGLYAQTTPFNRHPDQGTLVAALEVWVQVLSTPEPGLAILGAGKRDVPFDAGMPVPLRVRGGDGSRRPLPDATVDGLNDQHAYLRGADVRPGELVCLGISHPCTAFDRWRVIPVVDDDYRVVDLLRTYF
jgi:D-serine deaminase-like pyridoxal phosphate-dependent protein